MPSVRLFWMALLPVWMWAQVHYARLDPYQSYAIKAAYAGTVVAADDGLEGKTANAQVVVQIEDVVDRAQKRAIETTIETLEKTLAITRRMVENQQTVFKKDRDYYRRILPLKTKSRTEKDRVFSTMIASQNQLLNLQEKIATLEKQLADAKAQRIALKDRIEKKRITVPGLYIYKVAVRAGDYVAPGKLLLTAMDLRKGRLVLYLDPDEMKGIEKKRIYLDGKPTDWRFEKIIRVADEKHISSYRAEIVVPKPEGLFSRLLKIEIK